jgi:hypothetical protein
LPQHNPEMRANGLSFKQLAARGLLALAFLFAQQTAALHWLSHAVEATQAKAGKGAPPGHHCDECLTLGALVAGATSAGFTLPLAGAQHALPGVASDAVSPAPLRLAFRSRAPPVLT